MLGGLRLWLQLACSEQFQFLPGAAVIYQISSSGRFLSSVVSGESAANLRKVVHAVLERLRAREHVSQRFEDDVEAGIVTRIAGQFEMLQELDAKRTYLLTRPAGIPPPGSDVPAALDVGARPALREPLAGGPARSDPGILLALSPGEPAHQASTLLGACG